MLASCEGTPGELGKAVPDSDDVVDRHHQPVTRKSFPGTLCFTPRGSASSKIYPAGIDQTYLDEFIGAFECLL